MSPRVFCRRVTSLGTVALSLSVSRWCILASVCHWEGHHLRTATSIGRLTVDHSSASNQIASARHTSAPPTSHLPVSISFCVGLMCLVSIPLTPLTSPWAPHWPSSSQLIRCAILTRPPPPFTKKKKMLKRVSEPLGPGSSASVLSLLAVVLYS